MKVILTQTIPKIGKEGHVVTVADGFARNFLFPKGLAILADKAALAQLERRRSKMAMEIEKTRASALQAAEKINGQTIRIVGKTAKGSTKLFGAVTSADIAEAIKEQLGVAVDKKMVALLHPIKRIGVHEVLIDLHQDVDAVVRLEVTDEEGRLGIELEEAAPQAAESASSEGISTESEEVVEKVSEEKPKRTRSQKTQKAKLSE
ncbi:MAG TPA: 50S ribosomal protein L9 [Fimbriimonadales bacterium]|nr:50S ribosomal protein L9 [Fimbriimonadales bacterium]